MDLTPPRGTQDFLPPQSDRLLALYDAAHRVATAFGYAYVETPTFEATELFTRTSGETSDVVEKEMYTFQDRGKRQITLRPEGTAPLVRAYLTKVQGLPKPFKGYYIETLFRYGRPQAGRLREFRSFGVEVLGAPDPAADVDVIAVGDALVRYLRRYQKGVLENVQLQLNSIGDGNCRPTYREKLIAHFDANRDRLRDEHRDRFHDNPLRVLDCKDDSCREVSKDAPLIVNHLCQPCAEHFEAVKRGLGDAGVSYVLVPTLVRGLDYYTRTAFEFVSPSLSGSQATIIGGGRYDGLAEVLGGPATPAVGFGSGIERLLLALGPKWDHRILPFERHKSLWCFVAPARENVIPYAQAVARELRGQWCRVSVDMSFSTKSLKAQLRMADRLGARFAIIVGESEARAGTVTVRRMKDGEERRDLTVEGLFDWIHQEHEASRKREEESPDAGAKGESRDV